MLPSHRTKSNYIKLLYVKKKSSLYRFVAHVPIHIGSSYKGETHTQSSYTIKISASASQNHIRSLFIQTLVAFFDSLSLPLSVHNSHLSIFLSYVAVGSERAARTQRHGTVLYSGQVAKRIALTVVGQLF